MVRYYFGNKEGLFETMLRESLQPMLDKISHLLKQASDKTLYDLMRAHYMSMLNAPRFSRLISQVMHMPASDKSRQLVEKVFTDSIKPSNDLLFERLVEEGIIHPDLDPDLCRFSFISLMVFPFIAPPAMMALHGFTLNQSFIESLLEHNIRLLKTGMIVPTHTPQHSQGTCNEI
jgi:AcrR family transcriptional regulator